MKRLVIIVCVCLTGSLMIAQTKISRNGFELFRLGNYLAAAEKWSDDASKLLSESWDDYSLSEAAFNYLFATITYEKINSPNAYFSWSRTIQLFLQSNTTWRLERNKLEEKETEIHNRLNHTIPNFDAYAISEEEDIFLLELINELNLLEYEGPRPGIIANNSEFSSEEVPDYSGEEESSDFIQSKDEDYLIIRGVNPTIDVDNSYNISEDQEDTVGVISSLTYFELDENESLKENMDIGEVFVIPQQENSRLRTSGYLINELLITQWAEKAWDYFKVNFNKETGLVNSVNRYHYSTMWDIAGNLAGYYSAFKLGIIDSTEYFSKTEQAFNSIENLPLYNKELPNREYDIKNLKMGGVKGAKVGAGWSAIDIGRLLVWFKIISTASPRFSEKIEKIITKWDFRRLAHNNEMFGTYKGRRREYHWQEGRFGYEQYSAMGFSLWGVNLSEALDYSNNNSFSLYGIDVQHDVRNLSFLTSEPFYLAKMELGFIDSVFEETTSKVYQLQKERYKRTKILTAITEDALDKKPWFAYNSILFNDSPWVCATISGKNVDNLKTFSVKAAYSWYVIYGDDYSDLIIEKAQKLVSRINGFYAGQYENGQINKSLNLNTNAVVLEALLYLSRNKEAFLQRN